MTRRVVVTGIGLVTPVGNETASTWEALCAGRSGVGPIASFDASDQDGRISIVRWPLRSFYQPDYIAAYATAGGTFLVTANDVVHSWWVPHLAVKKDAIPGFINEATTRTSVEGVYRGQCAELCGKNHGFMPIVVNVVSKEAYGEWFSKKQAEAAEIKELMAQTFTLDDQMARGKVVYDSNCLACHGANGEGGVGKPIAGSAVATGELGRHLDVSINGVPGTAMQAFGGQLNDVDMAAVVTYQRNAFGNNMGDVVQPIDVYNHKKGQ